MVSPSYSSVILGPPPVPFLLNLFHPSPPSQVVTEPGLSSLGHAAKFPLAIYFTYGRAYASMLLSPSHPLLPLPRLLSISLFSMSASPLLSCKKVHQYHLSRFHIYALMYDICFSLSDFLLHNRL